MEHIWLWAGGILVAAAPSIISGVVMYKANRHQKKMEARDAEKARYEYLCLENLNAITCVVKELYACQYKGIPPNGELEDAFNYMQQTKHNLEDHLRQTATKNQER